MAGPEPPLDRNKGVVIPHSTWTWTIIQSAQLIWLGAGDHRSVAALNPAFFFHISRWEGPKK
jgi:hypothetical protein